jgi:L-asparaginase II
LGAHQYHPIFELTRNETIESTHYGAAAVVDAHGCLIASIGDPYSITFLRSSAKPIQLLSFIENCGHTTFNLTRREIALICASHAGTDQHIEVLQAIQEKTGVKELDLLCGTHPPMDKATAQALRERGEEPTPNRHNCSGKHTGMLAYSQMLEITKDDYINPQHPVQIHILEAFSQMCDLPIEQISIGVDGCSAPIFAVPLYNAALAYARLSDPERGSVKPAERATACRRISEAMTTHPVMVSGPGRFDTRLMEACRGRLLAKGGAEGYQAIGLTHGAIGSDSAGLGIAIKISDGDLKSRSKSAVSLEILRQLGALSAGELDALAEFGPYLPVYNWRKLVVGQSRPCFELKRYPAQSQ